jgi:hypothetical protein
LRYIRLFISFFCILSAFSLITCFSDFIDTDGDGLSDKLENDGWEVTYEDGFKRQHSYIVRSNHKETDTDGDGLSDFIEHQLGSDPSSKDTDCDALQDSIEGLYGANLLDADSDDDAIPENSTTPDGTMLDYGEVNIYLTSPTMEDTDGDGMSDQYEISGGGFNPLIADTPRLKVHVPDDPYIRIIKTESDGSTSISTESIKLKKRSYSKLENTDTTSNETTATVTKKTTKVKETNFGMVTKNETKTEVDASGQFVENNTTSFTQESARSAQEEYYAGEEDISSESTDATGGLLTISYQIENLSNVSVKVSKLMLTVLKRKRDGSLKPIITLDPISEYGSFSVGPNSMTGRFTMDGELNLELTRELLLNPSSLITEVGLFSISRTNNQGDEVLNYTDISTSILERTTRLVIDYGDGRLSDKYSIRTTFKRDSTGQQTGISVREALDILKNDPKIDIDYEPMLYDVYDLETGFLLGESEHLGRVGHISSSTLKEGFWSINSTSDSLGDPLVDFNDMILKRGDLTILIFMRDSDLDGLLDREEYLIGSDPYIADTDGDTLDDFEEVKEGWMVEGVTVYSDPRNSDTDMDGYDDLQEKANGTDPYNPD